MRTRLRLLIPRWLSAAVAGSLLAVVPAPASAQFGGVVIDLRKLAQNILHYRVQLQQFAAQKQQLNAMRKLSRLNWRNLDQLAQQIDQVVAQANGIAYGLRQAETLFRHIFPGYTPPAGGWTPRDARTRTERTLATLQGVVAGAAAAAQEMQGARVTLGQIKSQMASVQGHEQALELETTMGGFTADQVTMLRQAVVMQANAQAVVEA
jgi:P-type conjugative transfer protein TrbJ